MSDDGILSLTQFSRRRQNFERNNQSDCSLYLRHHRTCTHCTNTCTPSSPVHAHTVPAPVPPSSPVHACALTCSGSCFVCILSASIGMTMSVVLLIRSLRTSYSFKRCVKTSPTLTNVDLLHPLHDRVFSRSSIIFSSPVYNGSRKL